MKRQSIGLRGLVNKTLKSSLSNIGGGVSDDDGRKRCTFTLSFVQWIWRIESWVRVGAVRNNVVENKGKFLIFTAH